MKGIRLLTFLPQASATLHFSNFRLISSFGPWPVHLQGWGLGLLDVSATRLGHSGCLVPVQDVGLGTWEVFMIKNSLPYS